MESRRRVNEIVIAAVRSIGVPATAIRRHHDVDPRRFRPPRCGHTLDELERRYLRWADSLMPGNRRALAERLGVSERTLSRKINEKWGSRMRFAEHEGEVAFVDEPSGAGSKTGSPESGTCERCRAVTVDPLR